MLPHLTFMAVFLKWPISVVLQRLTLALGVAGWLQLFWQSLSRAIITNDSVSGRKLSP